MSESNFAYDTTGSSLLMSHKLQMDKRDCTRLMDYYRIKIGNNNFNKIF